MKEKLKPMSQAFVKNALGLDGIIEALTRTAPVPPIPPGPDPYNDPRNSYFVFDDGTRALLANSEFHDNSTSEPTYYNTDSDFYLDTDTRGTVLMTQEQKAAVKEIVVGTDESKTAGFITIWDTYHYVRDAFAVKLVGDSSLPIFPNLTKLTIKQPWINRNISENYDKITSMTFGSILSSSPDGGWGPCVHSSALKEISFLSDVYYYGAQEDGLLPWCTISSMTLPETGTFSYLSGGFWGVVEPGTNLTIPQGCTFTVENYVMQQAFDSMTFEGREITAVQALPGYADGYDGPWGINTGPHEGKVIHCSDGDITFPPRSDS